MSDPSREQHIHRSSIPCSQNTSGQEINADVKQESDGSDSCTSVRAATMFNVLDSNVVATPRRRAIIIAALLPVSSGGTQET